MPVILDEKDWPQWLGEADVTPEELQGMLKSFAAERMRAYKISNSVNTGKNDDESIPARDVLIRARTASGKSRHPEQPRLFFPTGSGGKKETPGRMPGAPRQTRRCL